MAVQHQRAKGGRVVLDTASRVWVWRVERGAMPAIRQKTVNVLHSKQNVAARLSRTPTCILGRSLVLAAISSYGRRLFPPASMVVLMWR
jgi:hypothetical protein